MSRDIPFVFSRPDPARKWLYAILKIEKKDAGQISFVFTGDKFLITVNRKHLGHNFFTDVITFAYPELSVLPVRNRAKKISGDILISVERVSENAEKFRVPFQEELLRVMVHGMLHLCGYTDDKHKAKDVMRKKEEKYLKEYLKIGDR